MSCGLVVGTCKLFCFLLFVNRRVESVSEEQRIIVIYLVVPIGIIRTMSYINHIPTKLTCVRVLITTVGRRGLPIFMRSFSLGSGFRTLWGATVVVEYEKDTYYVVLDCE